MESKFQPESMAAKCPICLRQLERFFVQHFKKCPRDWLKELQLRSARRLISEGWSNQAVVEELGFANAAHFCHKFKQFYGASPQTFAPLYQSQSRTNGHRKLLKPTSARRSFLSQQELCRL